MSMERIKIRFYDGDLHELREAQAKMVDWPFSFAVWWHFGRLGLDPASREAAIEAMLATRSIPVFQMTNTRTGEVAEGCEAEVFRRWSDARIAEVAQ